jgi:acyl-CoA dehydrogenase
MQKQAARKRTFEELPKPDIYRSYRQITAKYETRTDEGIFEITFDNVRIPVRNRIGAKGDGFPLAQEWTGIGRIKNAARALGVEERCLELASRCSQERTTFGKPLSEHQAIQFMLVDSFIELKAARLMLYQAASDMDAGESARVDTYVCKMSAGEMAFHVADRCMQIHGGIGLTKDTAVKKFWRQQRSYCITEGATDVMKAAIARHVLRTYR